MLEGSWKPKDERESELMGEIFVATRKAYNEGVERRRICGLLAFFASSVIDPASDKNADDSVTTPEESNRKSMSERMEEAESQKEITGCPECGSEIEDVILGLGEAEFLPCHCVSNLVDLSENKVNAITELANL